VTREEQQGVGLPDRSALALAERLIARGSSPSARLHRSETRARVRAAFADLPERDREVLVLRHLEELSAREAAEVLGLTEGAVRVRHLRALHRLRELLGPNLRGGE
jgi:RNA polymerase sigma-70 factor (ECF subfamily)